MDYRRIHKPQGGGFSPEKLRAMLPGVEKRRKEEEELEFKGSLPSEPSDFEDGRPNAADGCKDVEMEMASGYGSRDHVVGAPKVRSQEEDSFGSESASSGFESQKAERTPPQRMTATAAIVPPFSKSARSKWDDAEKWIASPMSNRGGSKAGGGQAKRTGLGGCGSRPPAAAAAQVVLEVVEEADTKRVDGSQAKKEIGGIRSLNWAGEPHAVLDSGAKPAVVMENPVADSAVNVSLHDSSTSIQSATTFMAPAPTVRSVSMRDMGTEMTPIASQEPSQTGTPAGATSPLCSPTSSRPSTPRRRAPVSTQIDSADSHNDFDNNELYETELQKKTRREIMALGQQLGKTNIAAWARKEKETVTSVSTEIALEDQPTKSVEAHAAAWEEAEKTKYLSRFKQEEIKIQAWENHQKATIEAEMLKIEVEVERMRAYANEKLMNHLASVRHKAEEKRAAADAERNQQAVKTSQQAENIRRTGQIPSFSCWNWCS